MVQPLTNFDGQPIYIKKFFDEFAPIVNGMGARILQNLYMKNTFAQVSCEFVKVHQDAGTISVDDQNNVLRNQQASNAAYELLSTPRLLKTELLKVRAGLNPIDYFEQYNGYMNTPKRINVGEDSTSLVNMDHKQYIITKLIRILLDQFDNALLNGDKATPFDSPATMMDGLKTIIQNDAGVTPIVTGAIDGTNIIAAIEDTMLATLPGKEYQKRYVMFLSPQNRLLYERKWREAYQSVLTGNDMITRIPGTGVEIHAHPHLSGNGIYLFKPDEIKLGFNFDWAGEAYADFAGGRIFIYHTFPASIQYENSANIYINDQL
jgi:hypothetical protein